MVGQGIVLKATGAVYQRPGVSRADMIGVGLLTVLVEYLRLVIA